MKIRNHYILLFIFIIASFSCGTNKIYVADVDARKYEISSDYKDDPVIDSIIQPYKAVLDSKMKRVIAYNPVVLEKQKPNSNMGNWFADLLSDIAVKEWGNKVDFAFQNYGGIRLPSIGKGNISVGTIYELMPFDNTLVLIQADGNTIKMILDHISDYGGAPISKQVSFVKTGDTASNILIHNEALDMQKTYYVAMPDYSANGGDGFDFLVNVPRQNSDTFIRDMVIDYFDDTPEIDTLVVDSTPRILTQK